MRIHTVPDELRSPGHRYPSHNTSNGLEGHFDEFTHQHASDLDTDWIYLPVRWTNNYVRSRQARNDCDLEACPQHQSVLDSLSPGERYFTVVQCDDGIYEDTPKNLLVFGAGGVGDIPVPLICSPHTRARGGTRPWFASFIGEVNACGPKKTDGKMRRSGSDPDSSARRIRQGIASRFLREPQCLVDSVYKGSDYFCQEMIKTVFALSPRGYGRTSFRMYEAIELGCIPVYIYDEPWLPYTDVIDWREFSVLCSQGDIDSLPERLKSISDSWRQSALSLADRLYDDYFTLDGMSRQIFRMIMERT